MICGDSHIVAMGVPLRTIDNSCRIEHISRHGPAVFGAVGMWPRDQSIYWEYVRQNCEGMNVLACFGGNSHLANFLFAPKVPFDFFVNSQPHLPVNRAVDVIPETAVREFLSANARDLVPFVRVLENSCSRILVAGSPPPKGDDEFVRSRLKSEQHFVRAAERRGFDLDAIALSPQLFRLKLWFVLQEILESVAQDNGWLFLPVPEDSRTPDGFLARECYADDVTHANERFGDQMVAAAWAALQEGGSMQQLGRCDNGSSIP